MTQRPLRPSPSVRSWYKLGKKWHIVFADYSWGQSTRDAYVEAIKKAGGEVVGATGIPIGTPDMTPFLSKISGNFDGLFGIFFGGDGVTLGTQAYDLGLSKKYKFAGDGAMTVPSNLPALGKKIEAFTASTATSRSSKARWTRPTTSASTKRR